MSSRAKPTTGAEALARWTDLVLEAERIVARPKASSIALGRACAWAARATVPAGDCNRDNPFVLLLRAADGFTRTPTDRRGAAAADLALALEVAGALRQLGEGAAPPPTAPVSSPPLLPFRRDIDG